MTYEEALELGAEKTVTYIKEQLAGAEWDFTVTTKLMTDIAGGDEKFYIAVLNAISIEKIHTVEKIDTLVKELVEIEKKVEDDERNTSIL